MLKNKCLEQLDAPLLKNSPNYVIVRLSIQDEFYDVGLQFNASGDLARIEINLFVSRDFWEEYTSDEMDAVIYQYKNNYNQLKEYCISELGLPDFSGSWEMDGYPENQTADHITFWDNTQGRIQIEFEHPDKEYPIFVRIACYVLPSSLSERKL